MSLVDILTPNQEEAALLSSLPTESLDEAKAAAKALLSFGMQAVIITLGELGCLIVKSMECLHVSGFRVETVDTVGAGDAFNGALAMALAEGRSLPESRAMGHAAGALAVTRSGAQGALPHRGEIERLVNS